MSILSQLCVSRLSCALGRAGVAVLAAMLPIMARAEPTQTSLSYWHSPQLGSFSSAIKATPSPSSFFGEDTNNIISSDQAQGYLVNTYTGPRPTLWGGLSPYVSLSQSTPLYSGHTDSQFSLHTGVDQPLQIGPQTFTLGVAHTRDIWAQQPSQEQTIQRLRTDVGGWGLLLAHNSLQLSPTSVIAEVSRPIALTTDSSLQLSLASRNFGQLDYLPRRLDIGLSYHLGRHDVVENTSWKITMGLTLSQDISPFIEQSRYGRLGYVGGYIGVELDW